MTRRAWLSSSFVREIGRSYRLISFTHEDTRPRPGDRAEPCATRDRRGVQQSERGKRRTERDEDIRDVAAPSQCQPPPAGGDRESNLVREQWQGEAPGALRWEVQRQAEPEETVDRTDHVQITRAGVEHRRVGVEQREPRLRDSGGTEPDDLSEARSDAGADPGRAQRAVTPARPDVGSHHGDERATEPEHERDQKVLEARAGAVARDRRGPEAADESGDRKSTRLNSSH